MTVYIDKRHGVRWAAQARLPGEEKQWLGYYPTERAAREAVEQFRPRPMRPWPERVVEVLAAHKRAGAAFDVAWRDALRRHPPRARDVGFRDDAALFDEYGQPELSVVDAFRGYCEQAWHGDKPKLAGFSLDMLRPSDVHTARSFSRAVA